MADENNPPALRRRPAADARDDAAIGRHYMVEKALARRLLDSSREERVGTGLYTAVYDEMFERVPDHPLFTRKTSETRSRNVIDWQYRLLARFLKPDMRFVEIGPGDCRLAWRVAESVREVAAVDVTRSLVDEAKMPHNFELVISDGASIPLPDASVDLVYSNQLMEHLHPDDAEEQLGEVFRILKPGGRYVFMTVNRLNGPWDISAFFDDEATGFHLKEYAIRDLLHLLRSKSFASTQALVGARGRYLQVPTWLVRMVEAPFSILPYALRFTIGRRMPLKLLLEPRLVARKPS
ncbi:MAG: class I SAM-dependent methyltransferase [Pseudomonadota bacterium]